MKKLFIIALLVIGLVSPVFADDSINSGEKTADAAVFAGPCVITSILIITDGTNNAKVILYDHASAASGTVRYETTVLGGDNYGGRLWTFPATFYNGIYADVSGTGASYIIEYIPR